MYGFIGAGNMGGSMVKSLLSLNNISPQQIVIYDLNINAIKSLKEKYPEIHLG